MSSHHELTVEEQAEIDRQVGTFLELHPRFIRNELNQALMLGFLRNHKLNASALTLAFAYREMHQHLDLLPPESRPQVVSAKPQREINVRPRLSSRPPQSEPPDPVPTTVDPGALAFATLVMQKLGGSR